MNRVRVAACGALTALLGAAACGGGDDPPLAAVEEAMADVTAGTIELELAATAGEEASRTGPVGFRLEGPFSLASSTELAVFDLEYTRLLGDDEWSTAVLSTGDEAFVRIDGEHLRVSDAAAGELALADGDGGLGGLGIADWGLDVTTSDGPEVEGRPTERFTGEVDASELLSDLVRLAGSVSGDDELEPLDDDAGERLQALVRTSRLEVIADAEDHSLRSLVAVVDFGAAVPEELRSSLGAYASPTIEVRLSLAPGADDLEVPAPTSYRDAG